MIIYYSMIAWIGILYLFKFISNQDMGIASGKGARESRRTAFLAMAYIVFWVGMRTRFADTPAYIKGFEAASASLSDIFYVNDLAPKSPGFMLLQILIKSLISTDFHVFLFLIAVLQGTALMVTFQKYSENYLFTIFLFLTTTRFTWMMNGIRQFIPVVLLFACTPWLIQRKKWLYFAAVLLLSTVHYSAWMMIPIYWCATEKPWGKKMWLSILLIILCAVFSETFTSVLESSVEGTVYDGITDQFAEDDGVNPLRVAIYLVPVVLSLFCKKHLEAENDPLINICINMSVLAAGLYFVGMFTSGILIGRLPIYCELYNLILYPYIFNHCFSHSSRKFMYAACAACYLVFFVWTAGGMFYQSDLTGYLGPL